MDNEAVIQSIVPNGVRALPLERYLARSYPMIPNWVISQTVKKRDARVNGARVSRIDVNAGDEVKAYIPDKYTDFSINVLYEGGGLLVVDKPAGLPVDTDRDGIGEDTVLSRARLINKNAELCHRLDAGTGGVLILATEKEALDEVLEAFRLHKLQKTYVCVVAGLMEKPSGTLTDYLLKDDEAAFVRVYSNPRLGAEKSVLTYDTLQSTSVSSLLKVNLVTGRTHQIRAQLWKAGHPILGDDKYGSRELNRLYNLKTPLLWCKQITYNGLEFVSCGGVKCI